jgi:DNA polymerase eta
MGSPKFTRSRFTFRDLRLLSQASVQSPLRTIALLDLDAFYAQYESVRLGIPDSKPLGVRQWNAVIAFNYAARKAGLKRGISIEEARSKCPGIVLQHVATWREGDSMWAYREDVEQHLTTDKAALDPYRIASRKILDVIKSTMAAKDWAMLEKASVDEFYLDLSSQVHETLLERYPEVLAPEYEISDTYLPLPHVDGLIWHTDKVIVDKDAIDRNEYLDWDDVALSIGSLIVCNLRQRIYEETGYTCSAGIARNKILAKLAAGHNKPNGQTMVRNASVAQFLAGYPFTKIRGLGRELGARITDAFESDQVSDLLCISLKELKSRLNPESGLWVFNVIRGLEFSEVAPRSQIQRMLSAKTFVPSITRLDQATKWLRIFAADLVGRVEEENSFSEEQRRPRTLALHHHINGRFGPTRSKQMPIPHSLKISTQTLLALSRELLERICKDGSSFPCVGLSVSIANFETLPRAKDQITAFMVDKRAPLPQKYNKSRHFVMNPAPESCDGYKCPNCGAQILATDVLEHLDWHFAKELQNEEH